MFSALGRKAAQQNFEDFIRGLSSNKEMALEVQTRTALYLRASAGRLGLPVNMFESDISGVENFLFGLEEQMPKLDALEASTKAKNRAMELNRLVGQSPNYFALIAVAGYFQMIGQTPFKERQTGRFSGKSKLSKDKQLLVKFRELHLEMFRGSEMLLVTDAAERAVEKTMGNKNHSWNLNA